MSATTIILLDEPRFGGLESLDSLVVMNCIVAPVSRIIMYVRAVSLKALRYGTGSALGSASV